MTGSSPVALLSAHTRLMLFVLTLSSVGVGFVALMTPAASDVFERSRFFKQHRRQLQEAAHRVELSERRIIDAEKRATAAEYSLRLQGEELEAALANQDDAALFRGRGKLGQWLLLGATVISLGGMIGVYAVLYLPLANRVSAQAAALAGSDQSHATELRALRTSFESERTTLRSALIDAQAKAQTAIEASAQAQTQLAALKSQAETAKPAPAVAARVEPKATPAKAKAAHAVSKAAAAAISSKHVTHAAVSAKAKKPAASDDDKPVKAPTKAKPGVADDDDPIAGLDNL